jgi:hypothetical protein
MSFIMNVSGTLRAVFAFFKYGYYESFTRK